MNAIELKTELAPTPVCRECWRPQLLGPTYHSFVGYIGGANGRFVEYELSTSKELRTICETPHPANDYHVSKDGTLLAFCITSTPQVNSKPVWTSSTTDVVVMDIETGTVKFRTPSAIDVMEFTMSPDGRHLAILQSDPDPDISATFDADFSNNLLVYDINSGCEVFATVTEANCWIHLAWSGDGRYLLCSGDKLVMTESSNDDEEDSDQQSSLKPPIQVWNVEAGQEVARFHVDLEAKQDPRVEGGIINFFVSVHSDYASLFLSVAELDEGHHTRYFRRQDLPYCPSRSTAFSCNSTGSILFGFQHEYGSVVRWNLRNSTLMDITPSPYGAIDCRQYSIVVHHDGTGIVSVYFDTVGFVAWTIPEGRILTPHVWHTKHIHHIYPADGGAEFLTISRVNSDIHRWSAESGRHLGSFRLPSDFGLQLTRVFPGEPGHLKFNTENGSISDIHLLSGKRYDVTFNTSRYWGEWHGYHATPDGYIIKLGKKPPSDSEEREDVTSKMIQMIVQGWSFGDGRPTFEYFGVNSTVTSNGDELLLSYQSPDESTLHIVWHPEISYCYEPDSGWKRQFHSRARTDDDQTRWRRPHNTPGSPHCTEFTWSGNGQSILVLPKPDCIPFILDKATGKVVSRWQAPIGSPLAAHPTMPWVVATGPEGLGIFVHDWSTGEVLLTLSNDLRPTAMCWGLGGTRLLVGVTVGTAKLFSITP